jgi:hypothetical protein
VTKSDLLSALQEDIERNGDGDVVIRTETGLLPNYTYDIDLVTAGRDRLVFTPGGRHTVR